MPKPSKKIIKPSAQMMNFWKDTTRNTDVDFKKCKIKKINTKFAPTICS